MPQSFFLHPNREVHLHTDDPEKPRIKDKIKD